MHVDLNVTLREPPVYIAPLNDAGILTVLSVDVQSILPAGFIDMIGFVVF